MSNTVIAKDFISNNVLSNNVVGNAPQERAVSHTPSLSGEMSAIRLFYATKVLDSIGLKKSVVGVDGILARGQARGICRNLAGEDVETFSVGGFGSGVFDFSLFVTKVGEYGDGAALGCAREDIEVGPGASPTVHPAAEYASP